MKLTNNQINLIEGLIIEGAEKSYRENLFFCGFQSNLQSRIIESLITINVAQKLLDFCLQNDLQINLEYPISDFYNGAFPALSWVGEDIFNRKMIRRLDHTPSVKKLGRIDIVITKEPFNEGLFYKPSLMSLLGIEIKAINKSNDKILNDINRIANSLILNDAISANNVSVGFSLFFRRLDNPKEIITEKIIKKKKQREIEYWKKQIDNLLNEKVKYVIKEIVIEESPIELISEYYSPDHFDYSEVADNSGLVVCYLVKLENN